MPWSVPLSTSELTPGQRSLRARSAAYRSWANTSDSSARTAPARRAFNDRFAKYVDPDNKMPSVERARRAEQAKRAYFLDLAFRSARARQKLAGKFKDHGDIAPDDERSIGADKCGNNVT